MALPATGPLSMSQVNVELGYASTRATSLNEAAVRALAGRPSGSISFSHLRGKSANTVISVTVGLADITFGNFYGFHASTGTGLPTFGSRTPTTLNGATIIGLYLSGGIAQVRIQGNRPKNFFDTVLFQGASVRTSASADNYSHDSATNITTWAWYSHPTPSIWTNVGAVRTVTFT